VLSRARHAPGQFSEAPPKGCALLPLAEMETQQLGAFSPADTNLSCMLPLASTRLLSSSLSLLTSPPTLRRSAATSMSSSLVIPTSTEYADEARLAVQAVIRASFITHKVQSSLKQQDTETKVDKSPVTGPSSLAPS
jgi:hypothetical protein